MRDFTLDIYKQLLTRLLAAGYNFLPFREYLKNSKFKIQNSKLLLLRHDVDRLPLNSLTTAKIEYELGIKGTYYFRIVPESFNKEIIQQIADYGHEIGYHYEEMDLVLKSQKSPKGVLRTKVKGQKFQPVAAWPSAVKLRHEEKNKQQPTTNPQLPTSIIDSAYELFKVNLARLREVADIRTICMHGSPRSKYDNKLIWAKYDYNKLGILGEPYLDIDWNEFGYLTDTGRRWDGVAIRDKVKNQKSKVKSNSLLLEQPSHPASSIQHPESGTQHSECDFQHPTFRSTFDIIKAIEKNQVPPKIMFTIHPERWNDDWYLWTKQLVFQNIKNLVKRVILAQRGTS